MRNKLNITLYVVLLFACSCHPSLDLPSTDRGSADFTRSVAIGGDFLSGFQNDALAPHGQQHSIAAMLARQFALAGGTDFTQSLIPVATGIGISNKLWVQQYNTESHLGFKTDCNNVKDFFPLNSPVSQSAVIDYLQPQPGNNINDFSIPGARISDFFDPQFGNSTGNIYYHHFALSPGNTTIIEQAKMRQPTFLILMPGMEDIYNYARNGGYNSVITPAASFQVYLDSLLKNLTANGAKGVIATIPALESFPFYTLVPPRGVTLSATQADSLNQLTGLQLFKEGENGFMIETPPNSGNYRQMGKGEHVLLDVPLDSLKCYYLGVVQALPDRYSLDSSELAVISGAVASYNLIIRAKADQYNLALADMNLLFKDITSGIKWNGVTVNAEFISGGFFSLDGYHPHEKGYEIMSNKFLEAINSKYGSVIPWINCNDCNGIKFP